MHLPAIFMKAVLIACRRIEFEGMRREAAHSSFTIAVYRTDSSGM